MGEYFNWVNVDTEEYLCPADFDLGNKSHESSSKDNPLLQALYTLLSTRWCGDKIVFLGDEANLPFDTPYYVLNMLNDQSGPENYFDYICEDYRNVSGLFKEAEKQVREHIADWLIDRQSDRFEYPNEYGIDVQNPYAGLFMLSGKSFRYIVNHTKRIYYSLEETQISFSDGFLCDWLDPLPILMGYGRTVKSGLWLDDVIGVSDVCVSGYNLLPKMTLGKNDWALSIPEGKGSDSLTSMFMYVPIDLGRRCDTMEEYMIYPQDDKEKFCELCRLFEKIYPQFKKEKLITDPLDGELFQEYCHEEKRAVIIMECVFLNEIELRTNFKPDEYLAALEVKKIEETPKAEQWTFQIGPDWQKAFKPLILARGKKYFESGEVRNMQRDGNTYISTVLGTDIYEIEISVSENGVKEMHCTCPYAERDNCKHMAAVLFALESGTVSVEELPPAIQPPSVSHVPVEIPWLEAIDCLPESVVRKELQKRADRDERLKERLAVLYLGKLPEQQLQNWKADLQDIAISYTNRRGRIRDGDVPDFQKDLGNFLASKLPLLCEVKAVMDAFHLIWIVMETSMEWAVDDPYDDLRYLFSDCEEGLRKTFSLATDVQREQMLQWYREHRNENWPNDVDYVDCAFDALKEPVAPTVAKRIMRVFNHVPCFLSENEWIPFPKRHHIYYDFIEETEAYKEAKPVIEEIIKQNLGERYGRRGACNTIWPQRKQLLMERYGIEWFTPKELNPAVCFD